MIRVNKHIESFEELKELTCDDRYAKVVITSNRNKNLVNGLYVQLWYKVNKTEYLDLLGQLLRLSKSYETPIIREKLGGFYSELKDNQRLKVSSWEELFSLSDEYNFRINISHKLRNELVCID